MPDRELLLASAGAGKTREVIGKAIERAGEGRTVLILTYTQNNQAEITKRICEKLGALPSNIKVKGWFGFLLDDLIRPYQSCIFPRRVEGIFFNSQNPHKVEGTLFTKPGRTEYVNKKTLNPKHFLTTSADLAHTAFISKLACRLSEQEGNFRIERYGRKKIKYGLPFDRLSAIYDLIIIDEVQDLTGWDYAVLEKLRLLKGLEILCVGDFRQTIYLTHHDSKKPTTVSEKLAEFEKLGFETKMKFVSHRSVPDICAFADKIHQHLGFPETESKVLDSEEEHVGVFVVTREQYNEYCKAYSPVILRDNRNIERELCAGKKAYNFGEAKGLQFDHTLIVPTKRQIEYISGKDHAFKGMKTDQAINRFYVASTRARYSTAFLLDDENFRKGVSNWEGP